MSSIEEVGDNTTVEVFTLNLSPFINKLFLNVALSNQCLLRCKYNVR